MRLAWDSSWLIPCCAADGCHAHAGDNNGVAAAAGQVDFSPAFIWLLRDFQLRLEANGKPISPAEYLEEALLPIKATGAADIANKNQVGLPARRCVCQGRVAIDRRRRACAQQCVALPLTKQRAAGVCASSVAAQPSQHDSASCHAQPGPAAAELRLQLAGKDCEVGAVCCCRVLQMRQTIKAVFPDRDVAVMVRPALTEADLQKLDSLPNASLRPEFRKVRPHWGARQPLAGSSSPLNTLFSGTLIMLLFLEHLCQKTVESRLLAAGAP